MSGRREFDNTTVARLLGMYGLREQCCIPDCDGCELEIRRYRITFK